MSYKTTMTPSEDCVIQANDLGKCYKIYDNPKARLKQALWRGRKQYYKEFWALRNVNFKINRGESLGIIGRNGSGKSTLLQLICGTLTPSEGSLSSQGRIAALLELGSGFNPEFTGLENVYLNASLLGLSKEETDTKLDEILAFADIGEFIDQPVKAYSSGMTVRLAFAVIAHVNANILVVDEALAVGDAIFVQRCMRFIRKMREEKCLLFVSHDSEAVKNLCSHALWLSKGKAQAYGTCKTVSLEYLRYCYASSSGEEITITGQPPAKDGTIDEETINQFPKDFAETILDYGVVATCESNLEKSLGWKTGNAELTEVSLKSKTTKIDASMLRGGEEVVITIRAVIHANLKDPILGFIVKDRLGQSLFGENTLVAKNIDLVEGAKAGDAIEAIFQLWFPMLPSGKYSLTAAIANGDQSSHAQHHWSDNALIINVTSSSVTNGLAGAFISDVKFRMARD